MSKRKRNDEESNKMIKLGDKHWFGVNKNYKKAFKYYQQSDCLNNDPYAQYSIGECYFTGQGVKQDYKMALEYYTLGANQNHMPSLHKIGFCYLHGYGVNMDSDEAFKYFQMGLKYVDEDDDISGLYNELAYCYIYGKGVEQDHKQAFTYYELILSANKHNELALYNIGICYCYGRGVAKNCEKAQDFFRQSAKLGNTNALDTLGDSYMNGINGVSQNHKKALMYYRLGNNNKKLGDYYKCIRKNYKKAIHYYALCDLKHTIEYCEIKIIENFNISKDIEDYVYVYDLYVKHKHQNTNELKTKLVEKYVEKIQNVCTDIRNIIILYLL